MSTVGTKKTNIVDNTVHEISDDEDQINVSQKPKPNLTSEQFAPLPTPKENIPLTTNEETTDPPPNKENTPLQNPSDCAEIKPQSTDVEVTPDRPPSLIAIPRKASQPRCDREGYWSS